MSALADLQTAVTNLGSSISNEIEAVKQAIQASQNANNGAVAAADAQNIVQSLNALKKTVDDETTALNPTPTPAPAPTTPTAA